MKGLCDILSDILYKSVCYWFSFKLPRIVERQCKCVPTTNMKSFINVGNMYSGYNLKTTKSLDCAYIGMYGNYIEYNRLFNDRERKIDR